MIPFPSLFLTTYRKVKNALAWAIENWRIVLAFAIVMAFAWGTLRINALRSDLEDSRREAKEHAAMLAQTVAAAKELRERAERTINELANQNAAAVERMREAQQRERAILNTPESENGPVAPVLKRTLERLRENAQ